MYETYGTSCLIVDLSNEYGTFMGHMGHGERNDK
jgi:hypothetical protein